MPLIENFDSTKVPTLLQPLFPKLVDSFLRLSPTSHKAALQIMADRKLRFELDADKEEFLCQASAFITAEGPEFQRLKVGLKAMERTWAFSFAYFAMFRWLCTRHNAKLKGEKPENPYGLAEAIALLEWAQPKFDELTEELIPLGPWPEKLPSPSNPLPEIEFMQEVENFSIRTMGLVFLHEIGHFAKGDFDSQEGLAKPAHQSELDADDWAATISTENFDAEQLQTSANLVTMPFMLGVIAAVNAEESEEHPSLAVRLKAFAEKHIEPRRGDSKSLYNTALFACVTPLQTLLYLKNPTAMDTMPEFETVSEYIDWWEKVYV